MLMSMVLQRTHMDVIVRCPHTFDHIVYQIKKSEKECDDLTSLIVPLAVTTFYFYFVCHSFRNDIP